MFVVKLVSVLAIFFVAVLMLRGTLRTRSQKRRPSAEREIDAADPNNEQSIESLLDASITRLRVRALSNAIYRELVENPIDIDAKEALYARYGRVSLPPELAEDELFTTRSDLMVSARFLSKVNAWLKAAGETGKSDFFSASVLVGEVLVRQCAAQARSIVDQMRNDCVV